MNVNINNKQVATSAANLQELAAELALPAKGVAMAVDNKMVPRDAWAATQLAEGISIVVIKAACGG